ncbi:MAG: dNTP triphosphohydrolase [Burkholderiales bacterium]|nr:dNTP triphosphohydrolase [Opitutaceae bacterium]
MSFKLDWNRLLSAERPSSVAAGVGSVGAVGASRSREDRNPFEQDYDRVIFSAPFRRLAGKTQVHPFAQLDHVHNRLTHTLEVASVGRSLAEEAAKIVAARGEMPAGRSAVDFGFIVQAACLAHDMGNPPFGHAGEYAIRAWAAENLRDIFGDRCTDPDLAPALNDWRWFEGNAQSFRLVSRSDRNERDYFRFTHASLGAMIKYPWASDDARAAKGKHNVFSSERAVFDEMADSLGLRSADGVVARHPLSFLSEAADDICYRISDFEDAVEMGILPEAEVRKIFVAIAGGDAPGPISSLRAKAVGALIRAAAGVFAEDYEAILRGARETDLKASFPPAIFAAMTTIKEGYDTIFGHRRKVAVELGAHSLLGRILSGYAPAVRELTKESGGYAKLGFIHRRYLELAWSKEFILANETKGLAWWLGRVMDHVSGMTDAHATQVARELAGG